METLGHEGKKMMLKKFKSYYVVWKLNKENMESGK